MKVPDHILEILVNCRIENNVLYLPTQLDRKIYLAVNKHLGNLGGQWKRKLGGHLFDHDPRPDFERLLHTGQSIDKKKEFQFFPTPRPVAELICNLAELKNARLILEPEVGRGDLADVIYEQNQMVVGVELNTDMNRYLADKPYICLVGRDFLSYTSHNVRVFDRVAMNPPFSNQQDIDHVYHAFDLLKPYGLLVSVMSPSPFQRDNNKSIQFRAWLDQYEHEVFDVEEGAFKQSGTPIRTKIIKILKTPVQAK